MAFGVEKAEEKAMVLNRYVDEIMLFNPALKLVGEKSREEIISRHILDSASAYPSFLSNTRPGDRIADLGTGAGLPGIVLSILLPERSFVLVDRMTRRIGFLRAVKAKLKLENVEILASDIKDVKESFSLITCRAFRPLSEMAEEMAALSENAILYKGRKDNIQKELEDMEGAGYSFSSSITPVSVPGEEGERNIVILEKWRKR